MAAAIPTFHIDTIETPFGWLATVGYNELMVSAAAQTEDDATIRAMRAMARLLPIPSNGILDEH